MLTALLSGIWLASELGGCLLFNRQQIKVRGAVLQADW